MCGEMANRGRICGCVELGLKHSLDHLFPRSLALDGRYCRDRKKRLNLMRPFFFFFKFIFLSRLASVWTGRLSYEAVVRDRWRSRAPSRVSSLVESILRSREAKKGRSTTETCHQLFRWRSRNGIFELDENVLTPAEASKWGNLFCILS